jgi:hypothetical protein
MEAFAVKSPHSGIIYCIVNNVPPSHLVCVMLSVDLDRYVRGSFPEIFILPGFDRRNTCGDSATDCFASSFHLDR